MKLPLCKSIVLAAMFAIVGSQPLSAFVFDPNEIDKPGVERLHKRIDPYLDKQPDWLSSRLQMYWNTHATDVFINGEFYDHAGGEKAPAPTVVFSGVRTHATNYRRPKLEEIEPYQEDPRGMRLANQSLEGAPYEWAQLRATGNIIPSINNEISGLAKDAASLWVLTSDDRYAEIAAKVFDTYMTGIYYRNMPYDLNHGHQQTLVGMATFEVIHEDVLNNMVGLYDMLRPYLAEQYPGKEEIYDGAFKKWADVIIANGVPHNNWNLMQARFILYVALILADDAQYSDAKGRQYYIDRVLNESSIRQWSLKKLADYGYDPATGIWAECPGYSFVVINDITNIAEILRKQLGIDLYEEIPVINKAVEALSQYLYPDGRVLGFGDTHPGDIPARFRDRVGEVTPTFYAPNASWLVQRNGMDRYGSLMMALNGSEGNHMHANGISMELYGRGYRLGPDAGIGKTLYSGQDYLEYYSRFPAHNTVCVDGVSDYPVMKSNHPLTLESVFPEAGAKVDYTPVTFSDITFLEPETNSPQRRINSIVTTSDSTGYYVDIFRSHRNNGKDKMHDYFYHNMGQRMTLTDADGSDLALAPTDELAFAGAHLYAYSYIFDKTAAETAADIRADFIIDMPDSTLTTMTMWMKGEPDRTVFKALSPMTEGLSRMPDMPYNISEQPTLTFVARQKGEAWNRPFVAIFEPGSTSIPSTIETVTYPEVDGSESAVAIAVTHKNGNRDLILASDASDAEMKAEGVIAKGVYAICAPDMCFIGEGTYLSTPAFKIEAKTPGNILIEKTSDGYRYSSDVSFTIKFTSDKSHSQPNLPSRKLTLAPSSSMTSLATSVR